LTSDAPFAFDEVYEKNRERIYRLVLRLVRQAEDAEDLAQQVFLRAREKWEGFRGESEIATWLHRIAMNLAVDHIRRRRTRRETSLDAPLPGREEDGGSLADALPEASSSGDQVYEEHQRDLQVRQAVAELPEKYREVVILREMEGLSYEETAALLQLSVETVATRLFRARNQLKNALKNVL
jgi:RNA polymerase sigma-70 factor (ECF subfamily)